ncbi:MAG: hypothetical protein MZW92_40225 [Comamonadaceae bacterium]|nr:hypothetical protein [Comamonadaceae bacterium]
MRSNVDRCTTAPTTASTCAGRRSTDRSSSPRACGTSRCAPRTPGGCVRGNDGIEAAAP